jgi:hypothetical protein
MGNRNALEPPRLSTWKLLYGLTRHCLLLALVMLVAPATVTRTALAERAGFRFEGALTPLSQSAANTITLFNIVLPNDALVVGVFSYDTTALGVAIEPNALEFGQRISGGLTLQIGDTIKLTASDYSVSVAESVLRDVGEAPGASDVFAVHFNRLGLPNDPVLLVNGVAWSSFAAIVLDIAALTDSSGDPVLDEQTPLEVFERASSSFLSVFSGPVGMPGIFTLTSLNAIEVVPGDYNWDGRIDLADYSEWTAMYGRGNDPPADGNNDGVVDAADYTIWRDAFAGGIANSGESVPEPSSAVIAIFFLAVVQTRRSVCIIFC